MSVTNKLSEIINIYNNNLCDENTFYNALQFIQNNDFNGILKYNYIKLNKQLSNFSLYKNNDKKIIILCVFLIFIPYTQITEQNILKNGIVYEASQEINCLQANQIGWPHAHQN